MRDVLRRLAFLWLTSLGWGLPGWSQDSGSCRLLPPDAVPKGSEFEYYSDSPALIGLPGHVARIDGSGTLKATGVNLSFFVGPDWKPPRLDQKSLLSGYLPVVSASMSVDSMVCEWTYFTSAVSVQEELQAVHFVSVSIRNQGKKTGALDLAAACSSPDIDPVQPFTPLMDFHFEGRRSIRGNRALCVASSEGILWAARDVPYEGPFQARTVYALSDTPVLWRCYSLSLRPGEKRRLDFLIPSEPIPETSSGILETLERALPAAYLDKVETQWQRFTLSGAKLSLCETKVAHALKANLITGWLLESDSSGGGVNAGNVLTASSVEDPLLTCLGIRALDCWGHHNEARESLMRLVEGQWLSTGLSGSELLARCQIVWALADHLRMTRDMGLARSGLSQCTTLLDRTPDSSQPDSMEGMGVEEAAWLLRALEDTVWLATFLKEEDLQQRALAELQRFQSGLQPRPAHPDSSWQELIPVFLGIQDPQEDSVTRHMKTLREERMEEGVLLSETGHMQPGLTCLLGEVHLKRNEQKDAVSCMYHSLLHTSSTHAGPDTGSLPWGDRTCAIPPPHPLFSRLYAILLREMFVKEEKDRLHLLSAASPHWFTPGKATALMGMPTSFGDLHLRTDADSGGAVISVETAFFEPPSAMILHMPWFARVKSAQCDGHSVDIKEDQIILTPKSHVVTLRWDVTQGDLSFARLARSFTEEAEARVARVSRETLWIPPLLPPLENEARQALFEKTWPAERESLASARRIWCSSGVLVGGALVGEAPGSGGAGISSMPGPLETSETDVQWIVAELESPSSVEAVRLSVAGLSTQQTACTVDISPDGTKWDSVATSDPLQACGMRRQIAFPPHEARFIRLTFRGASLRDVVEVNDVQFVKPCQERPFPLERNVALCKSMTGAQGQVAIWLTDGLLCEGPGQNQTIGETVTLDLENLRNLFGIAAWRMQTQDSVPLRIEVSSDNTQWTDLGSPVFAQGQKGLMLPLSGISGRYVRFSSTGALGALTEMEVYAAPESSSQTGG